MAGTICNTCGTEYSFLYDTHDEHDCVAKLVEENARLTRERDEARAEVEKERAYADASNQDAVAAEAKLAKVVEALEAMVIVMESGQPCYRTGNGIPQGMPRKVERVVRAALAPAKGEEP